MRRPDGSLEQSLCHSILAVTRRSSQANRSREDQERQASSPEAAHSTLSGMGQCVRG
jgi:hypothetical protein